MNVTVIFDEHASRKGLCTGFGLSLLIDNSVLFDAGSDGSAVVDNLHALGTDLRRIQTVVLSHPHWDHCDGLTKVLSALEKPTVRTTPGFPDAIRNSALDHGATVSIAYSPARISTAISATGELSGIWRGEAMPEQALLLHIRGDRYVLVCGCAHFGIADSLKRITTRMHDFLHTECRIEAVVGGMHLSHHDPAAIASVGESLREQGVRRIAPLHCSGESGRRVLRQMFGEGYINAAVGDTIHLSGD